jgi:hypothetical protein
MLINYETMFGSKPKEYSTPMAVTRNHYHSKQSTNNGRNNGSGTRNDNPEQTIREKTIYFPKQQR